MTPREQKEAILAELAGRRRIEGKTLVEVAEEVGYAEHTLGIWERGAGEPKLGALIAWGALFKLKLGWIKEES